MAQQNQRNEGRTIAADYVREENVVDLMTLQVHLSKLWSDLLPSFQSEKIGKYNVLQMQLNSIISRMQFEVLLLRMQQMQANILRRDT